MSDFFNLIRCVLSSVLPLRSVGRFNFDKVLHNLTTLIEKRHILVRTAVLYIYIYVYMINSNFFLNIFIPFLNQHY